LATRQNRCQPLIQDKGQIDSCGSDTAKDLRNGTTSQMGAAMSFACLASATIEYPRIKAKHPEAAAPMFHK